jgi:hypothetical protein
MLLEEVTMRKYICLTRTAALHSGVTPQEDFLIKVTCLYLQMASTSPPLPAMTRYTFLIRTAALLSGPIWQGMMLNQ